MWHVFRDLLCCPAYIRHCFWNCSLSSPLYNHKCSDYMTWAIQSATHSLNHAHSPCTLRVINAIIFNSKLSWLHSCKPHALVSRCRVPLRQCQATATALSCFIRRVHSTRVACYCTGNFSMFGVTGNTAANSRHIRAATQCMIAIKCDRSSEDGKLRYCHTF